jgi:hypothetical protein
MRKRDRIKVYHVAVCACLGHITCLVVCRHTRQEVPTARITNSSHLRRGTVLILEARLYRGAIPRAYLLVVLGGSTAVVCLR